MICGMRSGAHCYFFPTPTRRSGTERLDLCEKNNFFVIFFKCYTMCVDFHNSEKYTMQDLNLSSCTSQHESVNLRTSDMP